MKKSLEKRIVLFSFLILFLTILASTGMDIMVYRRDYIQALISSSQSLATSLALNLEKVLSLGLELKDIPGIDQKCREVAESNQPSGDYCVITDLEGKILYTSDPYFSSLQFNAIQRSLSTSTVERPVNLIGTEQTYYDTITPIRSPEGKQIALIHAGFPGAEVSARVKTMLLRSVFILAASFFLAFVLVYLFIRKSIMQPISILLEGVKKISSGHFDTRIRELTVYEFNELGKNISFMSESLKSRDEEIQNSYKELENTHQKLRASYERLANLSVELEKSEELYKTLLEDASDAIVVIGGDENIRIVNKMAEEFFGYTAQEVIGLPLTKFLLLLSIQDIPRLHGLFKDALQEKRVSEEMHFQTKTGKNLVARLHASSVLSADERLVQIMFRDITREQETLRNLEKSAEDLARLNRMKDSFLGLASHELKTPLTVIMGYSELILTDMAENIDPPTLEMLKNISNAAHRLDNIVRDMVDVSMIDERRLQLRLGTVNVNSLVDASVQELSYFFSLRGQKVSVVLDQNLPEIKGDDLRLMQLLINVLGNAIKFTPDGGSIVITTRAKYLLRSKQPVAHDRMLPLVNIGREHHMFVEVLIADTGIGIDRDDQIRIFDKFYEVGNIEEHSSGKTAFGSKGAGLGLAIAKGIVDMHGGEIWVESPGYNPELFPGSTFHILLPLDPLVGDATLDYMNILR